jgi:Ca-activated chloride channel family protein
MSREWASHRRTLSLAVLGALLIAVRIAAAQSGAGQQPPATFRSSVDLVTLHVSVLDDSGRYLTDLEQPEFEVFEDGRPQELRVFEPGGYPLAVTLFLDISSSMSHVFPKAQEAAIEFLQRLAPQDVASIVAFGDRVNILQTFTADQQALERAARQARARGATRLFNALYVGLKELSTSTTDDRSVPHGRLAVLLTDGDTASLVSFDDVLDVAKRSDVVVYAIRISGKLSLRDAARESEFVLRQLTRQTGGRAFLSQDGEGLQSVYDDIRTELSRQYALGYVSNDGRRDGRFRYLSVQLSRSGARARTRVGYFAPLAPFSPRQR